MKFDIPDPVFTVETRTFRNEPEPWVDSYYRATVMVGGVAVFRRQYVSGEVDPDAVSTCYDEETARDQVLEEFGNKLRSVLDEPIITDPWRA